MLLEKAMCRVEAAKGVLVEGRLRCLQHSTEQTTRKQTNLPGKWNVGSPLEHAESVASDPNSYLMIDP